jgi:hypothetical protein
MARSDVAAAGGMDTPAFCIIEKRCKLVPPAEALVPRLSGVLAGTQRLMHHDGRVVDQEDPIEIGIRSRSSLYRQKRIVSSVMAPCEESR